MAGERRGTVGFGGGSGRGAPAGIAAPAWSLALLISAALAGLWGRPLAAQSPAALAGRALAEADAEREEGAEEAAPEPEEEVRVIEIDTAGMRFTPKAIVVVQGSAVRFEVTAREVPHAFWVEDVELRRIVEFEGGNPRFQSGFQGIGIEAQVILTSQTAIFLGVFDKVGEKTFRCRFHHPQGMVGSIQVVESDPAAGAAIEATPTTGTETEKGESK